MAEIKSVCLDMDGTIADLYKFEGWKQHLEEKSIKPYLDCKPLGNIEKTAMMLNVLRDNGVKINIITWLSKQRHKDKKFDEQTIDAKKAWLAEYGIPHDNFIALPYGKNKSKAIKTKKNEQSIIIDDNYRVCRQWVHGQAINARYVNVNRALYFILKNLKAGKEVK